METRTKAAIDLFNQRKYKKAFKIFKTFRAVVTNEDRRVIQIAYESLSGKNSFYTAIGIDVNRMVEDAKTIIQTKFIR